MSNNNQEIRLSKEEVEEIDDIFENLSKEDLKEIEEASGVPFSLDPVSPPPTPAQGGLRQSPQLQFGGHAFSVPRLGELKVLQGEPLPAWEKLKAEKGVKEDSSDKWSYFQDGLFLVQRLMNSVPTLDDGWTIPKEYYYLRNICLNYNGICFSHQGVVNVNKYIHSHDVDLKDEDYSGRGKNVIGHVVDSFIGDEIHGRTSIKVLTVVVCITDEEIPEEIFSQLDKYVLQWSFTGEFTSRCLTCGYEYDGSRLPRDLTLCEHLKDVGTQGLEILTPRCINEVVLVRLGK